MDDLWSMICLGGVLVGTVGVVVTGFFAAVKLAKNPPAPRDDRDWWGGEPRDVPEDTVYDLRLDSALGAPLPGGVAAWLIAETQAEWATRQRGTGGVR